jgi:hypothetical protein
VLPLTRFLSTIDEGLTPQELGRLFQKFRQASSETHARFGGSGLGLYVARAITELMDGAIEVASEKGEGSSTFFTFAFPFPFLKNSSIMKTNQLIPFCLPGCYDSLPLLHQGWPAARRTSLPRRGGAEGLDARCS